MILPISISQVSGIIAVCHHMQPGDEFLDTNQKHNPWKRKKKTDSMDHLNLWKSAKET
jgi:hypothetical protein